MIFAKVNVDLLDHHRLLRIPKALRGAALGAWTGAVLYVRRHELDGFCPLEAIDHVSSEKVLDELVRVGLITREVQDGVSGIRVERYEEHNETKEEIAARRAETLKRVTRHRDNVRRNGVTGKECNALQPRVTGAFVPDSDSDSDSGSDLDLRAQRINPPAQSFQDSKGEPTSGVLRAADVLRTGENENRRPRKDPDIVAKALAETQRLHAALGGGK